MADMADMSPDVVEGESLSWSETWIKAVTEPSEESYTTIVNDPEASPRKAYLWVFITSVIGYALVASLGGLMAAGMLGMRGAGELAGGFFGALVCGGPVVGVISVIGLAIGAGIIQGIAKALGGEGTHSQLIYGMASYTAPISLVSSVLSIIPIVNYLSIPLSIYGIVLNVIAVKATNKFSWGRAIGASLGILVLIALIAGVVILVLALLGPAIGNIYSSID